MNGVFDQDEGHECHEFLDEVHECLIWIAGVADANILDMHLKRILENVKLLYLFEREGRWDASQNWEDILSLGEQQRLGMVSFHHITSHHYHMY